MSISEQSSLALPDLPGMGNGWEMLLPSAEVSRRCTATVAIQHEERRKAIVRACVHIGTRRVAEAFGVSREVVRAIRAEAIRVGELDQFKEEEGRRFHAVADRLLDRLEDEADRVPVGSLALNIGILLDKAQLLTGAPTARIQHEHSIGVLEAADYIDSLPSVTPVHTQEINPQKAAAPASIEIAAETREAVEINTRDSQSPVSDQTPEENAAQQAEVGQKRLKKRSRR